MAIIEVKVPQLSESVAEATLLEWHKKVGDAVERDENLIDIETDKVVLELPAPNSGVITEVLEVDGSTVIAGQLIARIDTEAKASTPAAAPDTAPASSDEVKGALAPATAPAPNPATAAAIAMPAAAKMMSESELSPDQLTGTGKDGRITKGDVIDQLDKPPAPAPNASAAPSSHSKPTAPTPAPDASPRSRPEERVPMSRLRARVAERLVESQANSAILTTFNEVNMQAVMDLRNKYRDRFEKEHGVRLGFMSFFVKAAVTALKRYPIINASVDGNDIVYHGYFDIGIAVSSPRGLVVPILRDADQMSLADIEKKIGELATNAKNAKLTLEDLSGGTFSISNGGVFGSMMSTPIINPPQSAILGIHATKDRPVVENGEIVIRPMNYLALSYDHRIVDGREAVLGLVAIKEALEDPARLLLDL